jgi:hypothetical protein
MTEFQIGLTLLNLKLFLLSQIMLIILMMAAIITNFHWGLHLLLQISKMAENEVKFKFSWIIEPNQFHKYKAKGHCRKRWWEISALARHTLHIEGKFHPLKDKFSSVGSLLWRSLQSKRDFEGEMTEFQMSFAQLHSWPGGFWKL